MKKTFDHFRSFFRSGSVRNREEKFGAGVVILNSGDSASMKYLLIPHLAAQGVQPDVIDLDRVPPQRIDSSECHTIIVARYITTSWLTLLRHFRETGGSVIYFMDDDLMDRHATRSLPAKYSKKIWKRATRHKADLEAICDGFWVSSVYLAEKYSNWNPKLLSPQVGIAQLSRNEAMRSVCYHGTASHRLELEWLVSVMSDVLSQRQETRFEVFGDHETNRLYRELPRVSVLHPMSWDSYLAYTSTVKHDIALAPLLPDPFNAARGPTKFFDFARMGAVGVYSDVAPYRGFIRDGIDGLLLPNEPAVWVQAISDLANDTPRRMRIAAAAQERAWSMVWDASASSNAPSA